MCCVVGSIVGTIIPSAQVNVNTELVINKCALVEHESSTSIDAVMEN